MSGPFRGWVKDTAKEALRASSISVLAAGFFAIKRSVPIYVAKNSILIEDDQRASPNLVMLPPH